MKIKQKGEDLMGFKKVGKLLNIGEPILISGETGTGKSRCAKIIYERSSINKEKFLTLHLASIKEDLIESELFGHKKGAFTGAIENKNGYFKEVNTGTLFLDEIGELTLEAQKKLLFILEEKLFVPVGAVTPIEFNGRLLFATNRNLAEMVKEGKFREDLYYRLMIFQVQLPPLRENKIELKMLIQEYFNNFKKKYLKNTLTLSYELTNFLESYHWHGNTRELKNCLEYLTALSDDSELKVRDLPLWIRQNKNEQINAEESVGDYSSAMANFEEKYLREMFIKYDGKVNETARKIKISKVNLINKAKKYQINTMQMRVISSQQEDLMAA
jgi:DNA-binding NtrC family response regulator